MSMRIHEIHPALSHFPLALLPVAFLADLLGRITGKSEFMRLGERLIPIAAVSGIATAAAGLVAQESVQVGGAHDVLVTHRNLNVGLVGLITVLAMMRMGKPRPSTVYLFASAGAMAGMSYTAYLGGKMVYHHGVGVMSAEGVREENAPEIRRGHLKETLYVAANNARDAAMHAIHHFRQGDAVPLLHRQ